MNRHGISEKLNNVFNAYLKSIKDENVRNLVSKSTIISGGAIMSMLCDEEINDYDLYFKNKETALAVMQYYANLFNNAAGNKTNKDGFNPGIMVIDGEKFRTEYLKKYLTGLCNLEINTYIHDDNLLQITFPDFRLPMLYKITPPERIRVYISSRGILNASEVAKAYDSIPDERVVEDQPDAHGRVEDIFGEAEALDTVDNLTIANSTNMVREILGSKINKYFPVFFSSNAITLKGKIQLIFRFYGEPETIHENFDFIHCTNYYDCSKRKLVLNNKALESILTKQLYYNNSVFPVSTLFRIRKFMKRGFNISAGEIFKIAYHVSKLDLDDVAVLEEQLAGVDSAYFQSFLAKIKRIKANGKDLTDTVIGNLIDKIFG